MGKLNRGDTVARIPVLETTSATPDTLNADGFPAYSRGIKAELFLMAVGAFYGEDKFYASASEESQRYAMMIEANTKADPEWTAAFLRWLRADANIRTAALVGAAEYVKAGGPKGRAVVNSVIRRADEPGEIMAYWSSKYGQRRPQPLKRGVRDAIARLYNERNAAKWDSSKAAFRFADIIELVRPAPSDQEQSDLFRYLIEDRHKRATFEGKALPNLELRDRALRSGDPREMLIRELERGNPTVTWETVSSAAPGKMTATQWERLYPHMGYMARLRNLRNLDQADVPLTGRRAIAEKLADPAEVAASKQLPMRFLSAYKAVENDVWHSYLAEALNHSLANVPEVKGRWLVLVDASGSMSARYSEKSSMSYYEAACVFAAAFARRNNADIRTYSNDLSEVFPVRKGESVLQTVNRLQARNFWFGGGTSTAQCLATAYRHGQYDHVLLLTDEQYNSGWYSWKGASSLPGEMIPATVPLYTFNLAGYKAAQTQSDSYRITVGGLSDAAFSMMAAVESSRGGRWPWEV
jgi:hypothetical protein